MSKKKVAFLDRFKGTVFDDYRKTGELRYLYSFLLMVCAFSVIAVAFVFVFNEVLFQGGFRGETSIRLILMFGTASLLLAISDMLSLNLSGIFPKLIIAIGVFYFFL